MKQLAKDLFEEAQTLRNNGETKGAINLYLKAFKEAAIEQDRFLFAESLHMVGVAYYQDKNFEQALDYLEKAKVEYEYDKNQEMVAAVLRDMGMVSVLKSQPEEAKEYYRQSIELLSGSDKKGHLGISKVKLGKLENSVDLIKEGIEDIKQSDDRFFEALAYVNLAEVEMENGKKNETLDDLKNAENILNGLGDESTNTSVRQNIKDLKQRLVSM